LRGEGCSRKEKKGERQSLCVFVREKERERERERKRKRERKRERNPE
jgi:hypothetical protein